MRLIITEKPSMGRDVAAALGVSKRRDGYLEGAADLVTWCVGHLVELDEPESYDPKFKQWRADHLPLLPEKFKYRPNERTLDQFKVIKDLLGRDDVTSVVNAADAGREGELIFDLVYSLSKCRKPTERLWISSLTREAILEGFDRLKPAAEYRGLRDSARSRQQADWLVGLNATRAQTIRARRVGGDGVYSLGRVQTPTLALIVERDREISEFVPVDYYEVLAEFSAAAGAYRGLWFNDKGSRFAKAEEAEAVAARVRERRGAVEKVEKKASKERPPLLYDLTTLQRAAGVRHGFSAARTLELAQSLYEKKFLTYPRTSSRHLSSSVNKELKDHVEAARVGPYAAFIDAIVSGGKLTLTARHVDDKKVTDHHAIIPTKQRVDPSALSPDEKRIYDLIARRFLAAFYPDAEIERTTITTGVVGERFLTRGTVVKKAGWREVDPPNRESQREAQRDGTGENQKSARAEDEEERDDGELPALGKGDEATATSAEAIKKQTKAPPRYSESSLLGAMETAGKKVEDDELRAAMKDAGLGTPATRAAIIETLLKREYVVREKKNLVATAKGAALIKMLPSTLLKSAELTGMWEQKLARMARGEYERATFMGEVKEMVAQLVKQIGTAEIEAASFAAAGGVGSSSPAARREMPRPDKALDCPQCVAEARAGFLIERESAGGKFLVCSLGREACGFLSDAPKNAKQRKAMAKTRCPICAAAMRLRLPKDKGRKISLSCCKYPQCRGVRWFNQEGELEEPVAPAAKDAASPAAATTATAAGPACAECGTATVMRGPASSGNYFWSCPRWRSDGSGCNVRPVWINQQRA